MRTAIFLFALQCLGCAGYRVGNDQLYAPQYRTVHVPMFESDSYRRFLGERLTEAVIREIELKSPLKVVSADLADTVLQGRIIQEVKGVSAENANDEPRDIAAHLQVRVVWTDRQGAVINKPLELPANLDAFSVRQSENFVPEAGQSLAVAHQRAIQRLAKEIVAQMEAAW